MYHVIITRTKSSRLLRLAYRVSILIQNRITVTRCTYNTLLYHLYIMLEKERTKRKSKIIFFLSIQKRGDLSTSCIRDYLSVISCLLYQISANDKLFPCRIVSFYLECYLDITEHQVALMFVPYLYF